jgi:hypothetical protein
MRMSTQAVRTITKNPMSAASKITKVVTDFFLPLADGFVPEYTPLTSTLDDDEALLLEKIWNTFPEIMGTKEDFVAKMGEIYDNGRQRCELLGEAEPDHEPQEEAESDRAEATDAPVQEGQPPRPRPRAVKRSKTSCRPQGYGEGGDST